MTTRISHSEQMIAFTVPGPPQPKERPRRARQGHVYTPKRTQQYEEKVRWYALAAGARRISRVGGPYSLTVHLHLPNRRRVDADNCLKTIADALNGVVWDDDAVVVELHVTKAIDRENPRAEVEIRSKEEQREAMGSELVCF